MDETTENSPPNRYLYTSIVVFGLLLAGACGPAGSSNGSNDNESDAGGSEGIEEIRSSKDRISDPSASDETVEELTGDNAAFAFDLYTEIAAEKDGENFFYSPHSLSVALAMTYAGAESTSETQMEEALHFELPEQDLHPAFNKLDQELASRSNQSGSSQKGKPFELTVANSTWGQRDYPFEQPYLDTLAEHYGAGLRGVDFQSKPENTREQINGWVADETDDNITEFLPSDFIDATTRLVLTNAVYFQANWMHQFGEQNTEPAEFTTASGDTVTVDMMYQELHKASHVSTEDAFSFASGDNWKAVEMPYVGGDVSMVVLVPDAGAFDQVESDLSADFVGSVFDSLSDHAVKLSLPKFGVESEFPVKERLEALGMEAPFDPAKADLSDIAEGDLSISDVRHQAFVSVDEKGTEAGAASGVGVAASEPEYKTVDVDRPFIFMIRDRPTDAVLFTGRVVDPS
jgi:serpin B